jgi:predicted Zn-dependent protease
MVRRLSVVPLGSVPRGLIEAAGAAASQLFELVPAPGPALAAPDYALNPSRSQYNAAAIVRKLAKIRGDSSDVILGVGQLDLFEPDGDHLIVDGDRQEVAGVVGYARLGAAGERRLLERVCTAGIAAVGRALGLRDCDDARCGMGTVSSPESLDKRQHKLCVTCETALAKGDRAWAKT